MEIDLLLQSEFATLFEILLVCAFTWLHKSICAKMPQDNGCVAKATRMMY